MGHADLYFREGPQAWKVCLLAFERTWEKDARAADKVLQVALRNDHSCLSQFECPEMRGVPPAVIVKGQSYPVRDPCGCPDIEAIDTAITRNVSIPTANFQVLGRCKQRGCK